MISAHARTAAVVESAGTVRDRRRETVLGVNPAISSTYRSEKSGKEVTSSSSTRVLFRRLNNNNNNDHHHPCNPSVEVRPLKRDPKGIIDDHTWSHLTRAVTKNIRYRTAPTELIAVLGFIESEEVHQDVILSQEGPLSDAQRIELIHSRGRVRFATIIAAELKLKNKAE